VVVDFVISVLALTCNVAFKCYPANPYATDHANQVYRV